MRYKLTNRPTSKLNSGSDLEKFLSAENYPAAALMLLFEQALLKIRLGT
jgi:hypothetical protein